MSDARGPAQGAAERATRVAAYALVRDADDRVLLARIAPGDPDPGAWTLPGGGLGFGEDPMAGALRELREETGLIGEIDGLAGVDSRHYGTEQTRSGREVHAIRIVYRVRVVGGTLRDEVGGSTDHAAWLTPDEIGRVPVVDLVTFALPGSGPMRSEIGIDVAAPPDLVFRLARDVERWPRLLPHYVSVEPLERAADGSLLTRMVARRPLVPWLGLGLPVAWRSRTWSEPHDRRLRFVHRGGATNGMEVTWRIEPRDGGAGSRSIEHDFRPRVPGWAAFVDRLFTRPIAGRTLATFRALAEALAEMPDPPPPTNHPT